jgi:glycosyltransferase involved in cell wall biosynthesis
MVLDRWLRIYFYGPHSVEMYGSLPSEIRAADVVHLHTVPYPHNFVGYLAARLRGKRVVITPHFHPGHPHYERWSNYWLLKHCDAVIAVSEYERDYLAAKGVDPDKIQVTGNGVNVGEYQPGDVARFRDALWRAHGLPRSARAIVFLGRKLEYKGIATLVEAFTRLSRTVEAVLFLAGPSTPWFDDFYASLSTQERARIVDLGVMAHQDKVDLLHMADVLVLPSQFEAFGIVMLEAWACQTPVICASTGAMPSIVGEGGLVFQHGDARDLAEKMERLLGDPQRAQAMADWGRERLLARYTWDKIATATRRAYRRGGLTARPMRVLICSNLFPPYTSGGAEIVVHREALILNDFGVEVEVFCGRPVTSPSRSYEATAETGTLKATRVTFTPADISGESWNFRNETIRRHFADVLDRFDPDVVHFHNLVGLSVKLVDECAARSIATVLTVHDYWGVCFKNTMLKNDGAVCGQGGFDCRGCKVILLAESSTPSPVRNSHVLLSLNKIDRFVSPSQYLADRYAANGFPADRISVLRNGIDLKRFENVRGSHETFTLGFIGYLGKHKGVDVLFQAVSLIAEPRPLRLLVVGDGEERSRLEALCRELGLHGVVTFCGRIENETITTIYEQIDALVVPSVWPENSPVTITEAMASGVPVIASDVGGIGELVDHEVTGLLAPPRDARALADLIVRLRHDPGLGRKLADNALDKIRQEDANARVAQLLQVFEDVSSSPRSRREPPGDVLLYAAARYWDAGVHEMLDALAAVERTVGRRLLICRIDLCDEATFRAAKLFLVPTSGRDGLRGALDALRVGVPLVVSKTAWEVSDVCHYANAGLVYAHGDELAECVRVLLTDDPLRRALGDNGRQFIAERAAQELPGG